MDGVWELGIDFGTANTRIALRYQGIPTELPIGEDGNSFIMPSVVSYGKSSLGLPEVESIGESALSTPSSNIIVQVSEIKRDLLYIEAREQKFMEAPDRPRTLWDSKILPDDFIEDVIYEILNEALLRAANQANKLGLNQSLTRANITDLATRIGIPVIAELWYREKMQTVMKRLGFSDFKVSHSIEEPVLAVQAYSQLRQVKEGELVMIYDLGGGTFDVDLVEIGENGQQVSLAVDGEPIGGLDIDKKFSEHLIGRIASDYYEFTDPAEFMQILDDEPLAKQVLLNRSRDVKEALSDNDETELILQRFLGDEVISIKVCREELENVITELRIVQRTGECALRAFKRASANLQGNIPTTARLTNANLAKYIQRIVVVGGSTKTPLIRKYISDTWGEELIVSDATIDPITAVATGAAWHSELPPVILNQLPFSIVLNHDQPNSQELYKAYTPTSHHKTLTGDPRIEPYTHRFELGKSQNDVISLVDVDGIVKSHTRLNGLFHLVCWLEIDEFARILLKDDSRNEMLEISNPVQHSMQREAWERKKKKREEVKAKEHATLLKKIREPPTGEIS